MCLLWQSGGLSLGPLIPIREGGETAVGNIVPARSRCDDSKQYLDYKEWIFSAAMNSPKAGGIGAHRNHM